jgi:hypothetical protein
MITFSKEEDRLILIYSPEYGQPDWVKRELWEKHEVTLKKTFHFQPEDLADQELLQQFAGRDKDEESEYGDDDEPDEEEIEFVLGVLTNNYYKISQPKVLYGFDLYIHKTVALDIKLFISDRNISIMAKLAQFINDDLYIGGQNKNAFPEQALRNLVAKFPNSYQKDLYAKSKISDILRDYFDNIIDHKAKYEKYLNKKASITGTNLISVLKGQELYKFEIIYNKLQEMLKQQESYNELQWQDEIIQIIRLLYPKYIYAFKNVQVKRRNQSNLFLDILLVDSGGYVDILEIKKPFDSAIITHSTYRDNHIPYRELSGTIMQIEKYIYYLNRWGPNGEDHLTAKFPDRLPASFEIKLTNPGGLVIMGRDNRMTPAQKQDFEVVKRKYKNVLDILTYDELLRRLKFTIDLLKKDNSFDSV